MRKFVKNISTFFLIGIILIITPIFFIDEYYGNSYYQIKHRYLLENLDRDSINTVIFGSSRLYRQINPHILDSLLEYYSISTFNLATPATYNPEALYLYEKFVSEIDTKTIKYAFIEFQLVTDIATQNIFTERASYWQNFKYLKFATKYYLNSGAEKKFIIKNIASYYLSFLHKIFNIKKLKYLYNSNQNYNYLGKNFDGYYSLDQQMLDDGENSEFTKRSNSFKADTLVHQKKINAALLSKTKEINHVFLQKIKEIIEMSEKKSIHVFFVIPPKLSNYDELYSYKTYLPEENIIDISSYEKYPLLYLSEFTFDDGHLNEKGATKFTNYLANEFKRITLYMR